MPSALPRPANSPALGALDLVSAARLPLPVPVTIPVKLISLFTEGKVKALTLSLADPDGFIAALQSSGQR